jgi:hypothetical protein
MFPAHRCDREKHPFNRFSPEDDQESASFSGRVAWQPAEWQVNRMRYLVAVCVAVLGATGCATTGLAWVHERESGVDLTPPEPSNEVARRAPDPPSPTPVIDTYADPSHRRLDRTITLGGTTESSVRPYAPTPAADPRGVAVVNVYVNQPPAYGASYGYGYASPVVVAPRATMVRTQPATVRPGLDWPAVPSYGPAFPYRMGPASPWDGADPRRR